MDLWKAFTHLYTIMFEQWLTTTFTILEYFYYWVEIFFIQRYFFI